MPRSPEIANFSSCHSEYDQLPLIGILFEVLVEVMVIRGSVSKSRALICDAVLFFSLPRSETELCGA